MNIVLNIPAISPTGLILHDVIPFHLQPIAPTLRNELPAPQLRGSLILKPEAPSIRLCRAPDASDTITIPLSPETANALLSALTTLTQ